MTDYKDINAEVSRIRQERERAVQHDRDSKRERRSEARQEETRLKEEEWARLGNIDAALDPLYRDFKQALSVYSTPLHTSVSVSIKRKKGYLDITRTLPHIPFCNGDLKERARITYDPETRLYSLTNEILKRHNYMAGGAEPSKRIKTWNYNKEDVTGDRKAMEAAFNTFVAEDILRVKGRVATFAAQFFIASIGVSAFLGCCATPLTWILSDNENDQKQSAPAPDP